MSEMTACIEMSKNEIDKLENSQLDEYIERLKSAQNMTGVEKNIKLALAYLKKDFIDEAAYYLHFAGDNITISQLIYAKNSVMQFAKGGRSDAFLDACCEGCCECSGNCCCESCCDNCDCDCS